jgi:hypothetical protein
LLPISEGGALLDPRNLAACHLGCNVRRQRERELHQPWRDRDEATRPRRVWHGAIR